MHCTHSTSSSAGGGRGARGVCGRQLSSRHEPRGGQEPPDRTQPHSGPRASRRGVGWCVCTASQPLSNRGPQAPVNMPRASGTRASKLTTTTPSRLPAGTNLWTAAGGATDTVNLMRWSKSGKSLKATHTPQLDIRAIWTQVRACLPCSPEVRCLCVPAVCSHMGQSMGGSRRD